MAICKKVLGDNHPDTATSLNNLGNLLSRQGDHAAARPYYEQALAIRKKVLGDKHSDTAISLNNLGNLLSRQGDHAAARPYYEQALAIRQQLAGMHERLENFAVAQKERREILTLKTKLHDDKAWQVTDARLDLQHVETLARLDAKARQELKEADQWMIKAIANKGLSGD